MPTAIDLANAALTRIGAQSIASLSDPSAEARACSRLFGTIRDQVLAARDWPFATAYYLMPAFGLAPVPWGYQYELPPDLIRIRSVVPSTTADVAALAAENADVVPFEEGYIAAADGISGTRVVRCDLSPATLVYTARLVNPETWPPGFGNAFSWALAAEIAMPITGSGAIAAQAQQSAVGALSSIVEPQSLGASGVQRRTASWLAVR